MLRLKFVEWALAGLLTATIVVLLFVRAQHASALWRDECATLQLSQLSVAEILRNFQRESFPPLVPLALHCYTHVAGSSDGALRGLGFAIGLLLVGAIWFNAIRLRLGVPLFGLSLLGLSTTFLVWGATIRGYGIGSALMLVAFTACAGAVLEENRKGVVLATCLSVVAVQILLYNSVLIAAITAAALGLACIRRRWSLAMAAFSIALVSAASILPWLLQFRREAQSTIVFGGPVSAEWLIGQFGLSLGTPPWLVATLWVCAGLALLVGAGAALFSAAGQQVERSRNLLVIALVTMAFSVVFYFGFLKIVSYRTREWYYLALITVLVACFDAAASVVSRYLFVRLARIVISVAALCALPASNWPRLLERQTNVDVIARKLESDAGNSDLIVCNPWYLGITFKWYYAGRTEWVSCPILADCSMHRFDLLKERMISPNALEDLLQMIKRRLQGNDRVWIVGDLLFVRAGESAQVLPPAPNSEYGWSSDAYADSWAQQIGDLLQKHAAAGGYASVANPGPVSPLENVHLLWAQGWRE
jgi:hypothetical protein